MFFTTRTAAEVIKAMNEAMEFACYCYHRRAGRNAAQVSTLFPGRGEQMEAQYQQQIAQEAA